MKGKTHVQALKLEKQQILTERLELIVVESDRSIYEKSLGCLAMQCGHPISSPDPIRPLQCN
ncbi:MAG: hypothetical protein PHQ23_16830, partial [Candidatus Wallbacteria bacterium]|nr:hypothetical protein [Candidatus Wallbacteria bacterium]